MIAAVCKNCGTNVYSQLYLLIMPYMVFKFKGLSSVHDSQVALGEVGPKNILFNIEGYFASFCRLWSPEAKTPLQQYRTTNFMEIMHSFSKNIGLFTPIAAIHDSAI